jgi:DegV family protein with EDD domain
MSRGFYLVVYNTQRRLLPPAHARIEMSRIALVTNTIAALPPDLVARHGITILPMLINFLDGAYEEGVDIDEVEFYERLEREVVVPATSAPTVSRYLRAFQELAAEHDTILSIPLSAALSDSNRNAQAAAQRLSGTRVLLHDSGSVAMGIGFQVLTAARLIERGAQIDDILTALQHQRQRTLALFTPATLRYMRNSRRVGPIAGVIATWLNIKPIIKVQEGRLTVLERARSMEAAMERQLDEVARFFSGAAPPELAICHAHAPIVAQSFVERAQARFPGVPIHVSDIGAVLAVHIGPGALGLMTYRP